MGHTEFIVQYQVNGYCRYYCRAFIPWDLNRSTTQVVVERARYLTVPHAPDLTYPTHQYKNLITIHDKTFKHNTTITVII